MVTALHQETRAAELERLLDLLVDHRLRQEVALALVAGATVEGAEVAVGDAEVRVVEVPVDDERDLLRVGQPVPDLVRDASDRDEIARAEERDRVLVGDARAVERPLEDAVDGRQRLDGDGHAVTSSRTKRSSGTWASSPTSRAISRKVYRPARSLGPKL